MKNQKRGPVIFHVLLLAAVLVDGDWEGRGEEHHL